MTYAEALEAMRQGKRTRHLDLSPGWVAILRPELDGQPGVKDGEPWYVNPKTGDVRQFATSDAWKTRADWRIVE